MIVSVTPTLAVAGPLLEYLRQRLDAPGLAYRQPPQAIPDGWETYIFRFQLRGRTRLPPAFSRPLILRAYAGGRCVGRLLHEFKVQRHLAALGYPVPVPLLVETDADVLGGPFMIMEWLPGRTLLELMFAQPWRVAAGPGAMARLHARLHQLPVGDFPGPNGSFLDRHLGRLRNEIVARDLSGLRPGFDWLLAHRPPEPRGRSILHLDFHPINMLFEGADCRGVLDWGDADVGDRHADVAVTLVLIESTPVTVSRWQRLSAVPGRWLLYRRYAKGYRARLPLDEGRLRYFQAWAALRRLARYGTWLRAGPGCTGSKPDCLRHVSREGIANLCRCFHRQTEVVVAL